MEVALTVVSIPRSLKIDSFLGLLMRAMVRGTLKRIFATWQATELSLSSPVTAMTMSARASLPLLRGRLEAVTGQHDVLTQLLADF